jgi:hypothetical protein
LFVQGKFSTFVDNEGISNRHKWQIDVYPINNEMKWNWNETNWNEMKWNETKRIEMKWIELNWIENAINIAMKYLDWDWKWNWDWDWDWDCLRSELRKVAENQWSPSPLKRDSEVMMRVWGFLDEFICFDVKITFEEILVIFTNIVDSVNHWLSHFLWERSINQSINQSIDRSIDRCNTLAMLQR